MFCWLKKKQLFEYAIGELPAHQVEKIEKHLKSCAKCRAYVEDMKKISNNLGEDQLFLNEVFWRKFDERLDINLAQEQKKVPLKQGVWNVKFLPSPLPRFAFSAAMAVCVLLIFISFSANNPFSVNRLQDEDLIETALFIENSAELNLNGDEDAYVEEVLLQIALEDA